MARRRSGTWIIVAVAGLLVALASLVPEALAGQHERLGVRVYVVDFDPLMDGGAPLTVDRGWSDPLALDAEYLAAVAAASGGVVNQRIVRSSVIRSFPVKPGGFTFTNAQYMSCLVNEPTEECKAIIDYPAVLNTAYDRKLGSPCDVLRKGRVDEIWLWGGPWFGYWEYQIVDPNTMCAGVSQRFVVMGFSYERGVAEMLHDLGHRSEALIRGGIGFELWDRFDGQRSRYGQDFACPPEPDAGHPEISGSVTHAGNVHFPPNAYCHYQFDRDHPVVSDADDWANFPNLTGATTVINATTWGGTQEGFMTWWLGRFPRNGGSTGGVANDWWRYVYPAARAHPRQ